MTSLSLADFRKRYPKANDLTDDQLIEVVADHYGASVDEMKAVLNYEPPAPRSRTWGEVAGDTLVTAAKSAVGLPQSIAGLIDIPTGGRVGKALEEVGYRPNEAQDMLSGMYSDPQKAANKRVADAQGFTDTAIAYAQNPSTIATTIGESAGQMLGGAGAARKLVSLFPKLAPWAAGALGEGLMGAGSAESQLRAESEDGLTTAKQGLSAVASGVGTAAFGALGGKIANSKLGQKVGIADIDTMLAGGGASPKTTVGFLKSALASGVSESALEEMPQSAWEQMMQNYAQDKPILDGVGKAMASGMVAGFAMGGAGGGYNAMVSKVEPPADIMNQSDIDSVINAAENSIQQLPVVQKEATPIDDPMRLEIINQLPEALRDAATRAYNIIIDDDAPKGIKKQNQKLLDDILEQAASEMQPIDTAPIEPPTIEQPKPLEPFEQIKQLQSKVSDLEANNPFEQDHLDSLNELQSAVTNYTASKLESGEMPVFTSGDMTIIVTPSAKQDGLFQVTRYSKNGALGDSEYTSIEKAVESEGLQYNTPLSGSEAVAAITQANEAEGNFQSRLAEQKIKESNRVLADIESTDSRVSFEQEKSRVNQRNAIIDSILASDAAVDMRPAQIADMVKSSMAEQGYANPVLSDSEFSRIKRFNDIAKAEPVAETIDETNLEGQAPSSNLSDLVPERKVNANQSNVIATKLPADLISVAEESKTKQEFWKALTARKIPLGPERNALMAAYKELKAQPITPTATPETQASETTATSIPNAASSVAPTEIPNTVTSVTPTEIPNRQSSISTTAIPKTEIASSTTSITPTAIPASATSVTPTEIPSSAATVTATEIPKTESVKASDIPRGEVGAMLESGQVVTTASGRETTPFPQVKTGTRNTGLTLKQVDRWLMTNAYNEAVSRGDDFNARQFKDTSNIQQADKDSAELYLFGESQPKVVPSILKPMVTQSATTEPSTTIPETTLKPDGNLSIKGDTKELQTQLKEAGIPSLPSKDGVTVGAKNVEKAQEFIASIVPAETKVPEVKTENNLSKTENNLVSVDSATIGPASKDYQSAIVAPANEAIDSGKAIKVELKDGSSVDLVNMTDKDGARTIVAVSDGNVVGSLGYATVEGFSPDAYVDKDFQRKGIASAMYDLAEKTGGVIPPVDATNAVRTEDGAAFRNARAGVLPSAESGIKLSNPAQQTTAQKGIALPYKKGKTGAETARNKLAYENPFLSFLATNGVSIQDRSDVGGDKKRGKLIPGHGPLFRKNAPRLDELAQLALEKGFITQAQMDSETDNGGVNALSEMINKAVRNEVVTTVKDVADNRDVDEELKQEASNLGIDISGKSSDEVYDLVKEHYDEKAYQEAIDMLNELSEESKDSSQEYNLQELIFDIEDLKNAEENSTRGEGTTSETESTGTRQTESGSGSTTETNTEQAQTSDAGSGNQDFRLTGETAQEARDRIAQEEREAQARTEDEARLAAAERESTVQREIADRQDIGADNFSLSSQVNDKSQQQKNDAKTAKDQLSGQSDIFSSNPVEAAKEQIQASDLTPAEKLANIAAVNRGDVSADDVAKALGDKKNESDKKNGEDLNEYDAVINTNILTIEDHQNVMMLARAGKINVQDIKAAYFSLKENEERIKQGLSAKKKDDLLKAGGYNFAANHKSDNKDQIVRSLFSDMMDDFAYFSSDSLSYGFGAGQRVKAIDDRIAGLTQDSLDKYAEKQKKKDEEAKAWMAERLEKMKAQEAGARDPVTLADFQTNLRAKMADGKTFAESRMMLTQEQRAQFDNLAAESTRAERAKNKVVAQEQTMRAPGEVLTAGETIKTKHTKHGHDLWQFNLDQRVSKEEYQQLSNQARKLGGDYSSYRGNGAIPGWQFRTPEAAQAFKDLIAGDNSAAKEVMAARRDAFADDRSQSASERLNEMAGALESDSEDQLNRDRKTNTARRAGMASRAEANARAGIAFANTMRNIANFIDKGKAKFLDKVREKKQVSLLTSAVEVAQYDQQKAQGLSYAEMEKQKGMPANQETADFAVFPSYTAYRSDLASLARQLLEVEGTKLFGKKLLDLADDTSAAYLAFAKENLNKVMTFSKKDGGLAAFTSKAAAENAITRSGYRGQAIAFMVKRGEYTIILSPSAAIKNGVWSGDGDKRITLSRDFGTELVEKIGRAARRGNKVSVPWQFESTYDKFKTLSRMNIETAAEYRAALREFISLREQPKEANKVKELERSMIGRKNDGMDFFPTPIATANEMVQVAEIKPGMKVLEPSAGWGHIAERIREFGVEPDVVELSGNRRELLEAKGFNLVGSDFLEVSKGEGYDRILMNPPFSDRRDADHVQHAYSLLKPGGRLVAIMGEGVFFGKDKSAQEFRDWVESVGGTDEKLAEGTFLDPSLPVNTSVSARMVVIDKADNVYSKSKANEANTDNGLGDVKIVPAVIVDKNVKSILAEEGAVQVNVSGGNVDVLKQIAERFGKKIVFFREVGTDRLQNKGLGLSTGSTESKSTANEGSDSVQGENGSDEVTNGFVTPRQPKLVFLNVDGANHLTYILGHELGHSLKIDDPKLWNEMTVQLQPLVRKFGKYRAEYGQGLTNDVDVLEELVSDVIGDNFLNNTFWQDMAKQSQSLFKRIADKAIALLNKSIRLMVGRDVSIFISDMDKARSIIAETMLKYVDGVSKGRYEAIASDAGNTKRSTSASSTANPHSWDSPEETKFDAFIYKFQDKHIDTKRVVDAIDKNISDEMNVYVKEETYHNKAASKNKEFINNELRPLIDSMREMDIDIPTLDEYLHARTAEETNVLIAWRNRDTGILKDGGSGMKTADARKYLASLTPAQRRNLESLAAKVDAITEGTRQMYVDYGLESKSTIDGWRDMFDHYVPLMREQDGDTQGMGVGQGFSVKGKEVKGRTGSTRKVVDIFANIAMQREKVIVRGEKNKVAKSLLELASANPNTEFWSVGKPETKRVYNPDTDSVVEQADPLFKSRENVIVAKVKGAGGKIEEKAIIFNEDNARALRMSQALKNLDTAQMNGFMGGMATVTRYFSAINTQYNPIFGAVNLVRDFQGALINLSSTAISGHKAEVAKHTLSALKAIYLDERAGKKGGANNSEMAKLWREFEAEGGPTGYRDMFGNSADRAKAIEKELNPTKWMDSPLGKVFTANGMLKVPMAVAQKQASGMFGVLSDYNTAMENAVRLAAYKVAKDQGLSNQKAASLAKNLTVNFNRKGQVAQQMGALYAFFNASMQGTARHAQTIFSIDNGDVKTIRLSSKGKKIVYGGVMLGVVQALWLAAAGFDEDEPPEFVRERSLIIPTGGKSFITVPMPLGLHVLPNLGRIPTEFALNGFKKPTEKVIGLMGLVAGAFNPTGGGVSLAQAISFTATDPIIALAENKDWTGKPIAKESYNKALPGHALTRDTASFASKMLSEGFNYVSGGTEYKKGVLSPTPDQIDYLFGQVFGGVGREAIKVQQSISATMTGEDLPIHKIPLVGRFYGNAETQSSQANRFYRIVEMLNEHETEIKGLKEDRKGLELARYMRENPEARMFEAANKVEREIQKLRKTKRDLLKNDAEPAQIKMIENQIKMRMTRFNESFASVSKSLN